MENLKYVFTSLISERRDKHLNNLKNTQSSEAEIDRWNKFYDKLAVKYGHLEKLT